jgi:hypothetical protein
MMQSFVQPNPRFGTTIPLGQNRLAALGASPAGNAAAVRSNPTMRYLGGDNQTTQPAPVAAPGTLDTAGLYQANQALSSPWGTAGTVGAAMVAPPLGLAALGARYATNPNSFLGSKLYGPDAGFYQAAKAGGPLNTPQPKPGRQPAAGVATKAPRELTLSGLGNGGMSGGSRNESGGYAGGNLGVSSFGGSASTQTTGSFGGVGGGTGSFSDRNEFSGSSWR